VRVEARISGQHDETHLEGLLRERT
jgi:hypothetical protein